MKFDRLGFNYNGSHAIRYPKKKRLPQTCETVSFFKALYVLFLLNDESFNKRLVGRNDLKKVHAAGKKTEVHRRRKISFFD